MKKALVRRWLNAAVAFAALVALTVGIPYGLCTQVGWPLPEMLPSWATISTSLQDAYVPDVFIVNTLAVLVWVAWVEVAASLLLEVAAITRGEMAQRRRFLGPAQLLVAYLVAALATLSVPSKPTAAQLPLAFAVATTPMQEDQPVADVAIHHQAVSALATVERPTYTVVRRDTLWSIAQRELGDPHRWRQIFDLNVGKQQADGKSLKVPDLIRPGWVLELPSDAAAHVDAASLPIVPPPVVAELETPASPAEVSESMETTTTTVVDADVDHADEHVEQETATVSLASGTVIGISLAIGMSGVLRVIRRRRRRNYIPSTPLSDIVRVDPLISDDLRSMQTAAHAHDKLPEVGLFENSPTTPGVVAIAHRDGQELTLDLLHMGVLRMAGVRATGVVRHLVAHLLSTFSHTDVEATVLRPLVAELVGAVEPFDGLRVEADVSTALRYLEAELLRRIRVQEEFDVDDFNAYRTAPHGEMANLLLLIVVEALPDELVLLRSLAERGQKFGIAIISLQQSMDDASLVIDQGGAISVAPVSELIGAASLSLSVLEAEEMLGLVAQARRWSEPALPMTEPPVEPFEPPAAEVTKDAPVRVRVFGNPSISVDGSEVQGRLRAKSLEMVMFLAMRPQGATLEVIGAALWPDGSRKQVGDRLSTVTSDVRRVLREATGLTDEKFVVKSKVYQLDASLVSCDLWDFTAAFERSSASGNVSSLSQAIEAYENHLGGDECYVWADDSREHFRRRSLDAFVRLAESKEVAGDLAGALEILEHAMQLDLYEEEIYRRVMRIESGLGRHDAARRTAELLRSRLEDIDLEPTEATSAVMAEVYESRRRAEQAAVAKERRVG